MMNQKATGGPAFPTKSATTGDVLGLSIRDYFAARAPEPSGSFARNGKKALQIIDLGCGRKKEAYVQQWESDAEYRARWAYAYADAMLVARGEQ